MVNKTIKNIEIDCERYTREHVVVVDSTRREYCDTDEWIAIPRETECHRFKYKPQAGEEEIKRMDVTARSIFEANARKRKLAIEALLSSPLAKQPGTQINVPGYKPVNNNMTPQSGLEGVSMMKSSLDEVSQNVKFSDNITSPVYSVDSEVDSTRRLQDVNDTTLQNFFSRPIAIAQYQWGTGTTLAQNFNPWSLYFGNKRVINRINNYNLLRAKLHLKVVINGNGFQYGRAVLAYLPLAAYDQLSTNSALVSADLVQTTQLPHVYLDPTTSQGGEIMLPFLWQKNYLNIPASDWTQLGECFLRSLNTLKHANGATDTATITVFAWAEDVTMSVLTNQDSSALVPQSGAEVDEANMKGVISGPATAISKAAEALSGIDMIKPYAMATSKAAGAVASVAKHFGYCAPPITKAPDPFKPQNVSSLALTNVPNNAFKLTLDDKQELTVDPRIAGLSGDDPMNIKDIAKRESYLTQFTWAIGTASDTMLWNTHVTPVTWAETGLTPNSYLFPPCCVAALPFKYWTGTMKLRFQIVCSSFHKGRLKFVYDPKYINAAEYNTNYMKIVDISKEQDFTLEIGNGQEYTLLDHADPGPNSVTEIYSTTPYAAIFPGNGVLAVYVLNELTTPNSTVNNDIQINVFVSAGDDFEVFVPDSSNFTNFVFKSQSGAEMDPAIVPESQATEEPSAPQQMMADKMAMPEQDLSNVNKVFTGEAITSFRPLLKRSAFHTAQLLGTGYSQDMHIRCMFPYLRGNVTDAVNVTAAAAPYNYCNTLLIHWVTYAFQGHRGSIRWKILPRRYSSANDRWAIYAQRNPLGIGIEYSDVINLNSTVLSTSQMAANSVQTLTALNTSPLAATGFDGSVYTDTSVNTALEIEIPYYSPFRFTPGKTQSYTGIETYDPTWRFTIQHFGNPASSVDLWTSTGEDYQVYMWTGLPRMYYESAPPAA